MSQNELVRIALNNRRLEAQGVPDRNALAAMRPYSICEALPHGLSEARSKQSGSCCPRYARPSGLPCGQAVSLRSAILRAEQVLRSLGEEGSPRLIGTALYGAVRRDAKQVAAPAPPAEPWWDPWLI